MAAATSHGDPSSNSPGKEQIHRNTVGSHERRAWCVAPFPDNERVVSASDDNTVVVWNFRTKEKEYCWSHKGATAVSVSHDGKKVVSGGRDCALQLWNAESGKHLAGPWKLHKQRVWSVSWSPDGNHIASCSADSTLIICSADSGEPIFEPLPTEQEASSRRCLLPKWGECRYWGARLYDQNLGCPQRVYTSNTARPYIVRLFSCLDQGWESNHIRICRSYCSNMGCFRAERISAHVFATASIDHAYLWNLKTRQRLAGPFELSKFDEGEWCCSSLTMKTLSLPVLKGVNCTPGTSEKSPRRFTGGMRRIGFSDIVNGDVTGSLDYDVSSDFFRV
ncbi:WD40-repeat-containing domain protein [Suillus subluteus]|nr:WD40-repeat-containing domain protein [Suillus subluteus]